MRLPDCGVGEEALRTEGFVLTGWKGFADESKRSLTLSLTVSWKLRVPNARENSGRYTYITRASFSSSSCMHFREQAEDSMRHATPRAA
jgi:hypothetical protein